MDLAFNLPSVNADDDKVCVVAASTAWPFYRMNAAYVCQEERYIQEDSGRLGFYTSRLIQGAAPRIERIYPSVPYDDRTAAALAFDPQPLQRRLGQVLAAALQEGYDRPAVQVVLLTAINAPETAMFEPIRHDGRAAWTMRQRYASLRRLLAADTTADVPAGEVMA